MSFLNPASEGASGWRFKLGGFHVSVPWNALIGVGFIAVLWFPEFGESATAIGQIGLAVAFGVLLMLSVLLHELAHAVAARWFGYDVTGITLWAMGGFTVFRTSKQHTPWREAVIAGAGPLTTLVVAGIGWVAAGAVSEGMAYDLLLALTQANLLVGFFNLLPGSPLDGGAIVKALVWAISGSDRTGQVVAAWTGRVLAVLIAISPFGLALTTGTQPSLPLVAVGLILAVLLWTGATQSLRQAEYSKRLTSATAVQLARPVALLDSSASVTEVLALASPDRHIVVLGGDGAPVGVVSLAAAAAVPDAARSATSASTVCTTVGSLPQVAPDDTALDVLEAAETANARYIAVADHSDPDKPALLGLIDANQVFVSEGP
ncbi:MAG: site-2 protease family protein [Micrococcales bacterium]|nr:site-2 protease family protein [Micrococcales bacterium]